MKDPKISVMSRVSLFDLATVCQFLDEKGRPPKTQSALIREAISILSSNIDTQVTDPEEAKKVLLKAGITFERDIKIEPKKEAIDIQL